MPTFGNFVGHFVGHFVEKSNISQLDKVGDEDTQSAKMRTGKRKGGLCSFAELLAGLRFAARQHDAQPRNPSSSTPESR